MHEDQTQFEQELRRGLKGLADRVPAGAGVEGVRRQLRRRAIRRTVSGIATVAVVIAMVAWLVPLQRAVQAPVPNQRVVPMIAETPLPEAIPVDASQARIEAAIRQCLADAGVTGGVWAAKDPVRGLSLVVSGGQSVSSERLQGVLASLLRCFDRFEMEMRDGQLQYQLFASRSPVAGGSNQG